LKFKVKVIAIALLSVILFAGFTPLYQESSINEHSIQSTGHNHNYVLRYDNVKHWKECTICGDRIDELEHYGMGSDGVCDFCGYTSIVCDHVYSTYYCKTDYYHYKVCTKCGDWDWSTYGSHIDSDNNGICDICGYGSNCNHDFTIHYYNTYHWRVCSKCHYINHLENHTASESQPDVCTFCGFRFEHTHNYITNSDKLHHWKECTVGGEVFEKYAHFDNDSNNLCDYCNRVLDDVSPQIINLSINPYVWSKSKQLVVTASDESGYINYALLKYASDMYNYSQYKDWQINNTFNIYENGVFRVVLDDKWGNRKWSDFITISTIDRLKPNSPDIIRRQ